MDASHLFTAALQLQKSWKVGSVDFEAITRGERV